MRGRAFGQIRGALAELAGVAAHREGDSLDRIDADSAFEIERVGAARQGLVTGAVDCRDSIANDALAKSAPGMDPPVRRRAELGAVDKRVLHEPVPIDAFDDRHPRQLGLPPPTATS